MGKSPAKWIKRTLFGKKSSKSNISKGREKVANHKEPLVIPRASETNLTSDPPLATHLTPTTVDRNEERLGLESEDAKNINQREIAAGNQETDAQGAILQDDDPEKIRLEQAATKAQAAFRGYLARRAFWALKGIIRLQALIRGHLVRRQAVSTLCCMFAIVKLQARVRGRRVRSSDIRFEVQNKSGQAKHLDGKLNPTSIGILTQIRKPSGNVFICKLLSSSPKVMVLLLQYDSWEPNSVPNWLERWSASQFWKPVPQPKKITDSKFHRKTGNVSNVESQTGKVKRGTRRLPASNIDSVSAQAQATSEIEKPKRNLRKVSSQPADSVMENPQNELEKVKRSLRKVHSPIVENGVRSEVDAETPKPITEKALTTSGPNIVEQGITNSVPHLPDTEVTPKPLMRKEVSELPNNELAMVDSKPPTDTKDKDKSISGNQTTDEPKDLAENSCKHENIAITNGELNHKEDSTGNENQKSSRKASVPVKQERAENGAQNSPTLPSYMAATESAKAKLRMQGSPRIEQVGAEKNNPARRHSLPSSTGSKISSHSPRTQRPVQASSKGVNKNDRSLSSSRDGNGKLAQVEWRR
ncbi:Protein IQ-DOMAIN 31 [Quillaja saponaria]|uniref:Protein IQ-DOMAIN 31 n=1 Tax=Quillaja saponaria TaxID=32244 RepID=A0AAD7LFE7_QUISA|nr:Protein IQ-DOMAIN 31 [Quillaja saponaria]